MSNPESASKVVFVSIQAYIKGELKALIYEFDYFRYRYKNNGPDECEFNFKTSDLSVVDADYLQEQVELRVSWGTLGGAVSKTRKVYIEELAYEYLDFGVEISIKAFDKGLSLNKGKSRRVINDKTIDETAAMLAELNGIKYSPIGFSEEGSDETYQIGYYDTDGKREGFTIDDGLGKYIQFPAVDNTAVAKFAVFEKKIPTVVQANNSDKYVLDDLLDNAEGGPYIAETRDDTLTIKKKNFSAKPVKTYTYKGETGKLLNFKPETKGRKSIAGSGKITAGGWDESSKEFYEGDATELTDDNMRLGESVEMPPDENSIKLAELAATSDNPDFAIQDLEYEISIPRKYSTATEAFKTKNDSGLDNYIPAIENTSVVMQTFDFLNRYEYGDYIATGEVNKEKVAPIANNKRTNAVLEKNPGSCKIEAEPELESNMVITILGVSKKHSGNYYIEECEHVIQNDYIVSCSLKRNGSGNVDNNNPTKVLVEDISKTTNSNVGPDEINPVNVVETTTPTNFKQ